MSMDRLPIIVSSSTLHEHFMENNYTGDLLHIDYVTSPGGTIRRLQKMWHIDYKNETKAMDILLVAGLNDFRSPNNIIMEHVQNFNSAVKMQSNLFHPEAPSTFRVATLLPAPQFVWFSGNGPFPNAAYINLSLIHI